MFGFRPGDLFSFDKMLATALIKLLYWIGLVAGTITAIVQLFAAIGLMGWSAGAGLGMLFAVLVGYVLGILGWRLFCEAMIILFRIYDRLGELRAAPPVLR